MKTPARFVSRTFPSCGFISAVSSLISVDFPAPLAPMTATRELSRTCSVMSVRAFLVPPG